MVIKNGQIVIIKNTVPNKQLGLMGYNCLPLGSKGKIIQVNNTSSIKETIYRFQDLKTNDEFWIVVHNLEILGKLKVPAWL